MEKLNDPIVVALDHVRDGERWTLAAGSADVLYAARQLTSGEVIAVSSVTEPDLGPVGDLGVGIVYAPEGSFTSRVPSAVADLIFAAIQDLDSDIGAVILPANYRGREATARLSVRLGGGGAVDVTAVKVQDGKLIASKTALGGAWVTQFSLDKGVPVLAMSPAMSELDEGIDPVIPHVRVIDPQLAPETAGVQVISSQRRTDDERGNLADAEIVVVGGRGVDGDFDMVSDLAAELGGAVGATRVACDEGWIDRSVQIGQTGVSISPRLYVGLGVSGAIHHTCGMQGSDVIVAVCDDPDAPIFEIADFGIVGDVGEVIPQAMAELQRLQANA